MSVVLSLDLQVERVKKLRHRKRLKSVLPSSGLTIKSHVHPHGSKGNFVGQDGKPLLRASAGLLPVTVPEIGKRLHRCAYRHSCVKTSPST